jgi:hypothetical protein
MILARLRFGGSPSKRSVELSFDFDYVTYFHREYVSLKGIYDVNSSSPLKLSFSCGGARGSRRGCAPLGRSDRRRSPAPEIQLRQDLCSHEVSVSKAEDMTKLAGKNACSDFMWA